MTDREQDRNQDRDPGVRGPREIQRGALEENNPNRGVKNKSGIEHPENLGKGGREERR